MVVCLLRYSATYASWFGVIVTIHPDNHKHDLVRSFFLFASDWVGSRFAWQIARHEEEQELDMSLMPNTRRNVDNLK